MANARTVRKAVARIAADPKLWNQDHWAASEVGQPACRTTMCLAGHACMVAIGPQAFAARYFKTVVDEDGEAYVDVDSDSMQVAAQLYLGLTHEEARDVFWVTGLRGQPRDLARFKNLITVYTGVTFEDEA